MKMDADENTRMMIKLASMMMQNQNAMKEAQSQLEAASVDIKTEVNDVTDDVMDTKPPKNDETSIATALVTNGEHTFGMDPKLMAEFARQIVMNANHQPGPEAPKRNHSDKPATIAQIIQSQQNGQTTSASSEGRIFVYNTLPDQNGTQTNGDVKPDVTSLAAITARNSGTNNRFHVPSTNRRSTIGPIRNRYGRVLRPGIDNFGRFEAVANPGLIMHAMELLRQKDKKKRGPKEKETFSVFMYCLPDKNSKLPKFSSLDPIERALVDQHQQEGYGYPAMDYINGIPRKTQLCLSFDVKKFRLHMIALYPNLEGRLYDMYRIDKTRRLIRVEARSPRQLKDMKYQGSLIVIPYDKNDEQPPSVIHRNFDDVYTNNNNSSSNNNNSNGSLGNPLSLIQNFNIPLPILPEVTSDAAKINNALREKNRLPVFPGQAVVPNADKLTKSPMNGHTSPGIEAMDISVDNSHGHFEHVRILQRASQLRKRLKETKTLYIRQDFLLDDVLTAYRENNDLHQKKMSVCMHNSGCHDDSDSQADDTITTGSLFVMFWEEVFRRYFTGNHQVVPVLDPNAPVDLFLLCGRILVHGLVLENYFPVRLSPALFTMLVSETCSDELLIASFNRVLSETEKEILDIAKKEISAGSENFSAKIAKSLKIILGSYGCRNLPEPHEFDQALMNISRSYLLLQPYWSVCQIRNGIEHTTFDIENISEDDVVQMYKILTPSVPTLLQRIHYVTSGKEESMPKSEQRVKSFFEQYLHKISKHALLKLLQQWCYYDCLCVPKLSVKFSEEDCHIEFLPKDCTLILPSSCSSYEELSQVFDYAIPAYNSTKRNTWEYTL